LSAENPYRCQWTENSKDRQTFQHDSGNVPLQIGGEQ
jgi:hypothetical protein